MQLYSHAPCMYEVAWDQEPLVQPPRHIAGTCKYIPLPCTEYRVLIVALGLTGSSTKFCAFNWLHFSYSAHLLPLISHSVEFVCVTHTPSHCATCTCVGAGTNSRRQPPGYPAPGQPLYIEPMVCSNTPGRTHPYPDTPRTSVLPGPQHPHYSDQSPGTVITEAAESVQW